jgi:NADH-quinone oxidoreductase subunit C
MGMTAENIFNGLQICAQSKCHPDRCGCVMSVFLDKGQLKDAAKRLLEKNYYIEDVTGMDVAEGIEVLYHFDHFDNPGRVVLRVLTDHENPEVPTISDIFSGAQWHERECFDFFGVKFTGHPQFRPLLMPADFTEHPLRKPEKNRQSLYEMLSACEPVPPAKGDRYCFEAPKEPEAPAAPEASDAGQPQTEKKE